MNASVQQLTSIKKQQQQDGEGTSPSIKTTKRWLSFFLFKGM